jgi:hypothetical protein
VGDDPPALSSFLQVKKMTVSPPSFKMYRVEIALHSLSIATQSHLMQPHSVPQLPLTAHGNVSIPGPILERTFPSLVHQFTGRVLPTAAQPEPVRFLTVVEIWSDTLQILPLLVPSSQLVPRMDVVISAHSGTQAHNKECASKEPVPERDALNRVAMDPDAALTEPASDSDFIDLTLSD